MTRDHISGTPDMPMPWRENMAGACQVIHKGYTSNVNAVNILIDENYHESLFIPEMELSTIHHLFEFI